MHGSVGYSSVQISSIHSTAPKDCSLPSLTCLEQGPLSKFCLTSALFRARKPVSEPRGARLRLWYHECATTPGSKTTADWDSRLSGLVVDRNDVCRKGSGAIGKMIRSNAYINGQKGFSSREHGNLSISPHRYGHLDLFATKAMRPISRLGVRC